MLPMTEQNMFLYFWNIRDQLLAQMIADGETSLPRVLGLYQSLNRRCQLLLDSAHTTGPDGALIYFLTGGGGWAPKEYVLENHPPQRLPDNTPLLNYTLVAGAKTVQPSRGDYDRVAVRYLGDLIRSRNFDAIVELGSGLGERLFEIYLGGGPANIPYFGAEYWESGRRGADRLAALEPALDFRSVPLDLTQPDLSFLAGFKNVLLFTNASAYCIPNLPADLPARLAAAAPRVTGVHFELIHHQVTTGKDELADMARLRSFNHDFADNMMRAHYSGQIVMEYVAPDAYMNSSAHPVTIMQWRNA